MKIQPNYLPNPRDRIGNTYTLSIITRSEIAEYPLPPFDLKLCIIALQRFLYCGLLTSAEELWWLRGTRTQVKMGQWTEIRRQGVAPFYTYSDGAIGRSGWKLPPNVRREDVGVITVPTPIPTSLRDYFKLLIENLNPNDPVDKQWKGPLLERAKVYLRY